MTTVQYRNIIVHTNSLSLYIHNMFCVCVCVLSAILYYISTLFKVKIEREKNEKWKSKLRSSLPAHAQKRVKSRKHSNVIWKYYKDEIYYASIHL